MTKPLLNIAIVAGILQILTTAAEAVQFRGAVTGRWKGGSDFIYTYGVSQSGIKAGDTFTWEYVYESDAMDGSFSPWENDLQIIKSDPLFPFSPGTVIHMDAVPFAWALTVADGQVTGISGPRERFVWEFDFLNPDSGQSEASHFSLGLEEFGGFGSGTVTWSDPVRVPDQTNTFACLLLSVGCLLAGRKLRREVDSCLVI
jgi:hypothetical protein